MAREAVMTEQRLRGDLAEGVLGDRFENEELLRERMRVMKMQNWV